jgi:hypothetical protein
MRAAFRNHEGGESPGPRGRELHVKESHAEQPHDHEDQEAPHQAHQPGAHQDMAEANGGDEFVLQALGPDGVQQGVGQVQLGDLDGVHGHRADEDEGHGGRVQFEKAGEQAHREDGHRRPEDHLEDREDVAPVHQGAAHREGPDLVEISG